MPILIAYLSIVILWSTTPLAIQWSTTDVGFLFGVTSRMLIGTLICLILMRLRKQRLSWNRDALVVYLSAASGIYGSMLFVYWGALYVPSGIIAIVFGLAPFLTLVFARLLLQETAIGISQIAGLALALLGLIITAQTRLTGFEYLTAGLLLLFASVTFHSLSAVLTKRYNTDMTALSVTTGGLVLSSLLFSATWFVFDGTMPESMPVHTLWAIVYLGSIATGAGFVLYYFLLSEIRPSSLALLTLITPVTAIMIGVLFNHEKLTTEILAGTGLIISGLALNLLTQRRKVVAPEMESTGDMEAEPSPDTEENA